MASIILCKFWRTSIKLLTDCLQLMRFFALFIDNFNFFVAFKDLFAYTRNKTRLHVIKGDFKGVYRSLGKSYPGLAFIFIMLPKTGDHFTASSWKRNKSFGFHGGRCKSYWNPLFHIGFSENQNFFFFLSECIVYNYGRLFRFVRFLYFHSFHT